VGVYDEEGALRYAGRVGTGFDDRALKRLRERLDALEQGAAPFADAPRGAQARGVHWTAPELVAEVRFSEWTGDGRLRHPVFQGLREDKGPADVRREREAHAERAGDPSGAPQPGKRRRAAKPAAASKPQPAPAPDPPRRSGKPVVGGVAISHPDRLVFPDPGLTKLDVAEYYAAVAGLMVPYLERRALTVIRCPGGIGSECFFQKHVTPSVPRTVSKVRVRGNRGAMTVYPVVDSAESLLAMVQNGAVEFHVWGSRTGAIETPDILVFDLDPAPELEWRRVREAARALRSELEERGLESFVRTSGGKGLHVVVPYSPEVDWAGAGAFARDVAETLAAREPDKYTATMSKAKRGGKVFLDHFRNGRGATSVTSYSLRARAGAPVALPISWDELARVGSGGEWTAGRVLRRLRTGRDDPWAGFWTVGRRQKLPSGDGRASGGEGE
jgi:bifunctional non-homologous end joining protein LigD